MAGFFKRLVSRVFPQKLTEEFELEAVEPKTLGYRLRGVVQLKGKRVPTPMIGKRGRVVLDGVTYRLDASSLETRSRIASRLNRSETFWERLFRGEEQESQLRTFLSASPEVRRTDLAERLLRREPAPLRVAADFDAETGETTIELGLEESPFELPDGEVGPVVEHAGRWWSVTPSQRSLLDRLTNRRPVPQGDGRYRFGPVATPEILPALRERADVEVSEAAAAVRVSDSQAQRVVELEESQEQSLLVRPLLDLPTDAQPVRPDAVVPVGADWSRYESQFFRTPAGDDAVFSALLGNGAEGAVVQPGRVPDFLTGPPHGPGDDVRRRWVGPALEVDPHPAEVQIEADLNAAGGLERVAWISSADGNALTPATDAPRDSRWFRDNRSFVRLPERGEIDGAIEEGSTLTNQDEIATYLVERETNPERRRRVRLGPGASKIRIDPNPASRISSRVRVDEETQTIQVDIAYSGEAGAFTHRQARDFAPSQRYFREGDTFQRIDPEAFRRVLADVEAAGGTETEEGYAFPAYLYDEVISRFSRLGVIEQDELFSKWLERLVDFDKIEPTPLPEALRAQWAPREESGRPLGIRPYQWSGYNWLCFLKRYGFGGVLADEMGLGKTVQVLLALARFKEEYGPWCSLIITAKSAMGHWEKDARTFFDGLTYRRWNDFERSVAAARPASIEPAFDFVVANYERVRADIHFLEKLRFRFVILDEAQRVKNPDSKTHKAVCRLRAESKIAVTATPVETRLRDLWSLFNVMMKGKLGSEIHFVARYEPRNHLQELDGRVRPFMLVRKKSMPEIEIQLPGKSYRDRDCDMTPEQRQIYDSIRDNERQRVVEETRSQQHVSMHIFAILTKLLQTCLHPHLAVGGSTDVRRSEKAMLVMQLLRELLDDPTNKILVFSRFVGAIALLEEWAEPVLRKTGAGSFTLIGRTSATSRQAMIEQFNDKKSRERVMFVSLMAGGVGVNLQGANHVIHFDRWWNPAVEWQAEDRAYRMNSERPVTVHRIVTVDSIEERVAAVIEERMALVRDVIDPQVAIEKLITREELLRIFGVDSSAGRSPLN